MDVTTQILGQGDLAVTVTVYQPASIRDFQLTSRRPLVLILPGGGFNFHSQRESEPVALAYVARGFSAVVVNYRLSDQAPVLPAALWQIGTVVEHFKRRAADYQIDPTRIVLTGFSAGGYLAALYAGLWVKEALSSRVGCSTADLQVAAVVLAYPVIGLRLGWPTKTADLKAITGDWTAHEADRVVTAQNPPTFIWATQTDELVPVANTLAYVHALTQAGVSVQAQLYDHGPHGLSLAQDWTAFPRSFRPQDPTFGAAYDQPEIAGWFDDQLVWLTRHLNLTHFWQHQ